MDWGWIARLFDPYERQARIAPALLVCLPVIVTAGAWFPAGFAGAQLASGSIVAYLGIAILATFARDAGKRVEPTLFKSWGGMPTTLLLRHRDSAVDATTKQRIHALLGARIPGIRFPSAEEEAHSPEAADQVYASATAWLRERTRDTKKFPLVLAENIGYGFRRNTFGVRRFALWVTLGILLLNAIGVAGTAGPNLTQLSAATIAAILITVALLLFWFGLVRASWVKEAAFAYAHRLLAACDSPFLAESTDAKARTKPAVVKR